MALQPAKKQATYSTSYFAKTKYVAAKTLAICNRYEILQNLEEDPFVGKGIGKDQNLEIRSIQRSDKNPVMNSIEKEKNYFSKTRYRHNYKEGATNTQVHKPSQRFEGQRRVQIA